MGANGAAAAVQVGVGVAQDAAGAGRDLPLATWDGRKQEITGLLVRSPPPPHDPAGEVRSTISSGTVRAQIPVLVALPPPWERHKLALQRPTYGNQAQPEYKTWTPLKDAYEALRPRSTGSTLDHG